MQDKMIETFNEQARQLFQPMRQLNALMLDNMERLTQYQLESLKHYSQMGTARMRHASEIADADGMRDFGTRQAEMMNELSRQVLEDARVMGEMSLAFKHQFAELVTQKGQKVADADEQGRERVPAKANSKASRSRTS